MAMARVNGLTPGLSSQRSCSLEGPVRAMNPTAALNHLRSAGQLRLAELAQLRREQHGERSFVELCPGPEWFPAREVVLGPAPVLRLRRHQMAKDAACICNLVRCEQRKGRERGVAGPHEMVAAERVRAITPRHAEAGDDGARIGTILVNLQHCRREQSRIAQGIVGSRQVQLRTPRLPGLQEFPAQRVETIRHRGARPACARRARTRQSQAPARRCRPGPGRSRPRYRCSADV